MGEHLSGEQLTVLLLGEQDEDAAGHASACAQCLAETQRMQAALGGFGEWARATGEHTEGFWARQRSAILERTQQQAARTWRLAWAAAMVVLMLTAALLTRPGQPAPRTPANISEWRSPTESLLRSPGSDFLSSTPRLGGFYFPLERNRQKVSKLKGGNNES